MPSQAPESSLAVGRVLDGKYRIDGLLGSGGMGRVVSATHLQLDHRVAVKLLLPGVVGRPDAVQRFLREARTVVQLRSEHVTRVLDVGTLEWGEPYIVMELLEGCDLATLLQNQGPLGQREAIDFVLQACDAVAEAHHHSIVHRDLKPQNLFLCRRPDGSPLIKVLDFGISKVQASGQSPDPSLTRTNDVMGSPNYMAPEQIRSSRDVDARADIWALGAILYELLTGRVPFIADSVLQLCALVLEQTPVPIESLRRDLSAPLQAVVHRCLQKDPAQRFASVLELMHALEQAKRECKEPSSSPTIEVLGLSPTLISSADQALASTRDAPSSLHSTGLHAFRPMLLAGTVVALLVGAGTYWALHARLHSSPSPSAPALIASEPTEKSAPPSEPAPLPPIPSSEAVLVSDIPSASASASTRAAPSGSSRRSSGKTTKSSVMAGSAPTSEPDNSLPPERK